MILKTNQKGIIKMTGMELKEILIKHKMWLNNEDGGECAILIGADLNRADFSGAKLEQIADVLDCSIDGLLSREKYINRKEN
ncbi:MAG: pentapeptide repeat-containing protein [Ruminococcus sp.]|nr:pentapeptide repeat-containing protein [Ruminococcus sp.]